jgi:hypothetical protein
LQQLPLDSSAIGLLSPASEIFNKKRVLHREIWLRQSAPITKIHIPVRNFDYYSEARLLGCPPKAVIRSEKLYNQSSWRWHHTSCTRKPAPVP